MTNANNPLSLERIDECLRSLHFALPDGSTTLSEQETIRAAFEFAKKFQWQPIETAPKNGDLILGWSKPWGEHVQTVRFLTGKNQWNVTMQPTHWMPLPEAPKEKP